MIEVLESIDYYGEMEECTPFLPESCHSDDSVWSQAHWRGCMRLKP